MDPPAAIGRISICYYDHSNNAQNLQAEWIIIIEWYQRITYKQKNYVSSKKNVGPASVNDVLSIKAVHKQQQIKSSVQSGHGLLLTK